MTEHPPTPPAPCLPELTDLELDIEICRVVYGYRWHDLGKRADGIRIYLFGDPTAPIAGEIVDLPPITMRGALMFNQAGEHCTTLLHDLKRPTQGFADAWSLARFVAHAQNLQVGLSYHTAAVGQGSESATITSWHRDEGEPDVSQRTCLLHWSDVSLERGVPRSILQLYKIPGAIK